MWKLAKLGLFGTIILALLLIPILFPVAINSPNIEVRLKKKSQHTYIHSLILPKNQTNIWVVREVYVSEFLAVKIVDIINITNTKDRPFSGISIFYPYDFWRKTQNIHIYGSYHNDSLHILDYSTTFVDGNYVNLKIRFYVYLDKYIAANNNTFRVYIHFDMKDNITEALYAGNQMWVRLNTTPSPYLPYPLKAYKVIVRSPDVPYISLDADRTHPNEGKTIQGNTLSYTKKDIPPMNFTLNSTEQFKTYKFKQRISVIWDVKNATPIIKQVSRSITITESYTIHIHDRLLVSAFSVIPMGASPKETPLKLPNVRLGLAPNATNIQVKDDVGKLGYSNTTSEEITKKVTTITISFSDRPIYPGEERQIDIDYYVKLNDKLLYDNNTFHLGIPLGPILNTTLSTLTLKIKSYLPIDLYIPTKFNTRILEYGDEKFFTARYTRIILGFVDILPSQNGFITILIHYDPLYFARSFMVLSLYVIVASVMLIELAFVIGFVSSKFLPPKEKRKIEHLERFIRAYETIVAYDKNTWADAYTNLFIKRPTNSFLNELSKRFTYVRQQYTKLLPLLNSLKKLGEIYDSLIELQKLEEEIDLLKQRVAVIVNDYLGGRLEKDVYLPRIEGLLLLLKDKLNIRERIVGSIRDYYLTLIG